MSTTVEQPTVGLKTDAAPAAAPPIVLTEKAANEVKKIIADQVAAGETRALHLRMRVVGVRRTPRGDEPCETWPLARLHALHLYSHHNRAQLLPALSSFHQEIAARVVANARELLGLRRSAQIDVSLERHKPHRERNRPTVTLKGREDPRVCPFEFGPRFCFRKTNAHA